MDDGTPTMAAAASASVSNAASTLSLRRFVLNLPPGYHFLPTDAELILYCLRARLSNQPLPLPIFVDERILDYHPHRLIEKYSEYGENRWFFFTKRQRKHQGGSRPNRATPDNGHLNATGSPSKIRYGGALVGCMRTLVFYEAPRGRKKNQGLPPPPEHDELQPPPEDEGKSNKSKSNKGVRTKWTMYEYESVTSEAEFVDATRDGNAKMDAIVLCTIQKKKHSAEGKEVEAKKTAMSKTKAKAAAGDDAAGSCGGGGGASKKPRKKRNQEEEAPEEQDHVQSTLLVETDGALEQELAFQVCTGVADDFPAVDPNANNMPHYYCFTNASPPVSAPPLETMMAPGGRGDNHIGVVHPSISMHQYAMMKNSLFQEPDFLAYFNSKSAHAQAPSSLAPDFLAYSNSKMAVAPARGGNSNIMAAAGAQHFAYERASLVPPEEQSTSWNYQYQQQIMVHNTTKIVPAAEVPFYGFGPGISYSNNYGFAGDHAAGLSTGMGYVDRSSFSFPSSQPSPGVVGSRSSTQGANLHNKVSFINHQSSATASMVGSSEEWRRRFSTGAQQGWPRQI